MCTPSIKFIGSVRALNCATFGEGRGLIIESVSCSGTERNLTACQLRDDPDGYCSHGEDAGVQCCE